MYRQGDVLLIPVDEVPIDAIKQKKQKLTVLAYGEKTGHMHAINAGCVQEYRLGEKKFFEISGKVILSHGLKKEIEDKIKVGKDHDAIQIPPGNYKVIIQREYTPERIRRVID